jgi:uncharacterized protein YdiU (UPF0061 family)
MLNLATTSRLCGFCFFNLFTMQRLSELGFKNEFTEAFPGDDSGDLRPRQTPGMMWSKAIPTPVKHPELLAWSDALARELGIAKPVSQEDIDILGGNIVTPSMHPYAACYAGHQFGHWAGQLGDGRAITLGELGGRDGKSWELQLKGAGPTAYSRRADGRAVLRSSLREYLMSEAMHYLGVPTTRALSLVATGDPVMRDMFYDGHPAYEPGAIVMRVAPTFLRFGNFEILAARGETESLKRLVDWTITRYYPHITGEDRVMRWFTEIMERTARLMVEWMRVGFVHGVMNTDNMSILGVTIDYGPYSFVDDYDPMFTPNTTDLPGRRYAFGRQASVAQWNLSCLAGALAPLFEDTKGLEAELNRYPEVFSHDYRSMMARKLGLGNFRNDDVSLVTRLEQALAAIKPDMTIFYRLLMDLPHNEIDEAEVAEFLSPALYKEIQPEELVLLNRLVKDLTDRRNSNELSPAINREQMNKANPVFIPRNYLLHQSIEELQQGNNGLFMRLQEAIKNPYDDVHDEDLLGRRPDWASQKAGCSMLSCSS